MGVSGRGGKTTLVLINYIYNCARVVRKTHELLANPARRAQHANGGDSLTVETDSLGAFAVFLPSAGGWLLTTTRLGYRAEGPSSLSVGEGRELEILIRLGAQALRLPPLEVRGVRQALTGREEIYQRIAKAREQGIGRASTRAQLEQLNPQSVGAALGMMTSQLRIVESPQMMVNTVFAGRPAGHVSARDLHRRFPGERPACQREPAD